MDNELTLSGTIIFPASGYLQGKIEWTAVGDPQNNRAIVTTNLYAHRTNNATTTGRSWTGKVKVGDNTVHNFTGFSTERSISSGYVLFATYTDVVDYEGSADKTITISGQVKGPSGTSLSNNTSSGSASVVLPTLHKSPEVIISSIQELNTSLGIANDTFVQYLSQKRFTLQGVVYDDVSITDYSISNGTNTITSQSNIIDFDFSNIDLFVETNVLPIKASIKDSYNSVGSITQNYSNYILYQKPTIEPTSTTTKRNGQTSGRCLLNMAGNYWVGQIGNTTNVPTVKYRYWEKGTTEPSTWETVSSGSVVINNGRVTVTDYEIGTNDNTQPNYFNYQKAYSIRVQIEDNYYSDNTLKGITVGEAVWSEYKDRVDFVKLQQKGKDVLTQNILWQNSDTTINFDSQQIQLDNSNYNYLIVMFKQNKNTDIILSSIAPKGYGIGIASCSVPTSSSYAPLLMKRDITYVNDTTFNVGNVETKRGNSTSGYATDNSLLIPIMVLGIL